MLEENKKCCFRDECSCVDCDTFCMKRFKTDFYFDEAFIPEEKRSKTPLRVDGDLSDIESFKRLSFIENNIRDYVESGKNLYIYSKQAGNGKTSWALRLARSYINEVWFDKDLKPIVLFISIPRFLTELKSNISAKSLYVEKIMNSCLDADVIIWDDIATKSGTEFEVFNLLNIIDQRISQNKCNIYTSNLSKNDLHEALGDRLYSRIVNYSECIELFGRDKRGLAK